MKYLRAIKLYGTGIITQLFDIQSTIFSVYVTGEQPFSKFGVTAVLFAYVYVSFKEDTDTDTDLRLSYNVPIPVNFSSVTSAPLAITNA